MNAKNPSDLTVIQLKERLRELGLPTWGNKAELIARLNETDPSGGWMEEIPHTAETGTTAREGMSELNAGSLASSNEREIETYRREAELAQRELQLVRREMELARVMPRLSATERGETTGQRDSQDFSRLSLTAIADLLSCFDGNNGENYENWEKQLKLIRTMYRLPDEHIKILMGMRLKGKASEWLQSRPEHIELPVDDLLDELREMFDHRPGRVMLRRRFEGRVWRKDETFHQYVHEKVILGNRVPISEDELVDYLIDGIPATSLRDQARISGIATKSSLLRAFEGVTLRDGASAGGARGPEQRRRRRDEGGVSGNGEVRCFNCGMRSHKGMDCPTKAEGPKCFRCGERGHIASRCTRQRDVVRRVDANITYKKYNKQVEVDGHKIVALVDTGSDICLLRAGMYVRLGAPRLNAREIRFRGIGSGDHATLGEFDADVTVDGYVYPILVRVVSDTLISHDLLIGTDFLNGVEMTTRAGEISIRPLLESSCVDEGVPEIFQINTDSNKVDNVDVMHVPGSNYQDRIRNLVDTYDPVKSRDVSLKMTIILKDEEPVYQRARRLSVTEKEQVNIQIEEWLRDGIIQPSLSEYASPIVLAKKKDGSTRLCVDYRQLNKKIIKDRYPLPLIEDQLDQLQGARFFSTLDLKNGFFHIPIDERSRKYTAFIVPDGHYEFLRVPFGLCNSPAVFQRFINIVFRDLVRSKTVFTYMDDLIVPSTDRESGIENLGIVLETASEAGLLINWKKCGFLKERVEFLGHVIEKGRVYPSQDKVEAVRKFPEPVNVKQIQSFLGLSGYFRKFIPCYSVIARPLSDLLKAGVSFVFGEHERDAFVHLKEALSNQPVLSLYTIGAETESHTDASMHGYGAILLQKGATDNAFHPVYYSSNKTTAAEQKYPSYELEVLAIVRALKKFRVYLLGIPFTIVTDCRAFAATMNKKDLCVRVARWALLLEEFDYKIEHRPGKNMMHVDALSRRPVPTCNLIKAQENGLTVKLKNAQKKDDDVRRIFDRAKLNGIDGYIVRGGLLCKENDGDLFVVVPRSM